MKSDFSSGRPRILKVTLLGVLVMTLGLVTYPVIFILSFGQGAGDQRLVVGYAYFAFALIASGLCTLFYGATTILTHWSTGETSENPVSKYAVIAQVLGKRRYSRLLLLSAFAYGIFYSFASGIIVFQPAVDFAAVYHVGIPSLAVAICCGPVGETPEAVVYVTQHVGLLIFPTNLLLLFSISWLVGLNSSFAAFALSSRSRNLRLGGFGGVGALIGLFTSCPTCAGLAIITLLGGTGSLSASFFFGPLQTFLFGLSIPILVATPIMTARSLSSLEGQTCAKP